MPHKTFLEIKERKRFSKQKLRDVITARSALPKKKKKKELKGILHSEVKGFQISNTENMKI